MSDINYTVEADVLSALQVIADRLHGGTDRERDEGHKIWLLLQRMVPMQQEPHEELREALAEVGPIVAQPGPHALMLASALRAIVNPDAPDKWGYGAAHNAFNDTKRAAAATALREYDAAGGGKPAHVVIVLEGGLVSWVGTSSALPIACAIIDYDVDGADDDEKADIPQDNGGTAEAIARIETADNSDPEWVEHAYNAIYGMGEEHE